MSHLSLFQSTATYMRFSSSCHMFLGSKCGLFLPIQGMSSMVEAWISQANARQRSGRAGRVRSGNCFCLYTRNRLEKLMRPFQVIYFSLQCAPLNNYLLTKSHVELGANSIVKVHVHLVMIKWQMNWITMWSFHSVFLPHMFFCCTLLLKTLVT